MSKIETHYIYDAEMYNVDSLLKPYSPRRGIGSIYISSGINISLRENSPLERAISLWVVLLNYYSPYLRALWGKYISMGSSQGGYPSVRESKKNALSNVVDIMGFKF